MRDNKMSKCKGLLLEVGIKLLRNDIYRDIDGMLFM